MKRAMAAVGAVLVMAGMLWLGVSRSGLTDSGVAAPSPRESVSDARPAETLAGATERIETLLADAGRGDVDAYLAAFRGPIHERLAQQADERGRSRFGQQLRSTALSRKSHAIFEAEPDGELRARVTVESTFADRIERQTFRLVREEPGWLIDEIDMARDRLPRDAIGALATYQEPEGQPVPARAPQISQEADSTQEP